MLFVVYRLLAIGYFPAIGFRGSNFGFESAMRVKRETGCMPFRSSFDFRISDLNPPSAQKSILVQFRLSPAVCSRYQTITRMIFGAKL